MQIDLNSDIGEGYPFDAQIIPLVSSVNIACGLHAGNVKTIRDCVRLAIQNNVAIGAHPSFADRENFGRTYTVISPDEVISLILYQLGAIAAIIKNEGGCMTHVKPHGALYNQAANDPILANAICQAVTLFDSNLMIFGLAGSELIRAAKQSGLIAIEEGFIDRTYQFDGSLTPRNIDGSLLTDTDKAWQQTILLINKQQVVTIDKKVIKVSVQSLCIHGDGKNALEIAKYIRENIFIKQPKAGGAYRNNN